MACCPHASHRPTPVTALGGLCAAQRGMSRGRAAPGSAAAAVGDAEPASGDSWCAEAWCQKLDVPVLEALAGRLGLRVAEVRDLRLKVAAALCVVWLTPTRSATGARAACVRECRTAHMIMTIE